MLYIAYGSNLNLPQMDRRCPEAVPITTAVLPGTRLVFRGSYSGYYLSIEPEVSGQPRSVPCVIWCVSKSDERSLDIYEGYPRFYKKCRYDVIGDDGKKYRAVAYQLPTTHPLGIPTQYYWNTCVEGYRSFGLPIEALRTALLDSVVTG